MKTLQQLMQQLTKCKRQRTITARKKGRHILTICENKSERQHLKELKLLAAAAVYTGSRE
jgi:hypothetical protein